MGSTSSSARDTVRVTAASASRSTPPSRSTITRTTEPLTSTSYSSTSCVGRRGSTISLTWSATTICTAPPLGVSGLSRHTKGVGLAHAFPRRKSNGTDEEVYPQAADPRSARTARGGANTTRPRSIGPGNEGDEVVLVFAVGHGAVGPLQAAHGDGPRRQLGLALAADQRPGQAADPLLADLGRLVER